MTTPVTQQNGLLHLVGMVQAGAAMGSTAAAPSPGLFAGVFSQAMQANSGQQGAMPWLAASPSTAGDSLPQEGQALPLMLGWMQQGELTEEQVAALSSFLAADNARSEAAFDTLLQKMPAQLREQMQQQQVAVVPDQAPHHILQNQLLDVLQGYAAGQSVVPLWQQSQVVWSQLQSMGDGSNQRQVEDRPIGRDTVQLVDTSGLLSSGLASEQVTPAIVKPEQLTMEGGMVDQDINNESTSQSVKPLFNGSIDPAASVEADELSGKHSETMVPVTQVVASMSDIEQASGVQSQSMQAEVDRVLPHQSAPQLANEPTSHAEGQFVDTLVKDVRADEGGVVSISPADESGVVSISPADAGEQGQSAPVAAAQVAASIGVASPALRSDAETRQKSEVRGAATQISSLASDVATSADEQVAPVQSLRPNQSVMSASKSNGENIAQVVVDNSEANTAQSGPARSSATDWLQAASQSLSALKPAVSTQPQLQMPAGMAPTHPGWSQSLSERVVWSAGQQLQSATIQLDPPELGSLHVKLHVVQDQVSVTFTSPHASVREAVEQSMPRLRELFEQQGLNLGESMVKDQSQGREQRQQQSYAQAERLGGQLNSSAEVASTQSSAQSLSLVDYYA